MFMSPKAPLPPPPPTCRFPIRAAPPRSVRLALPVPLPPPGPAVAPPLGLAAVPCLGLSPGVALVPDAAEFGPHWDGLRHSPVLGYNGWTQPDYCTAHRPG